MPRILVADESPAQLIDLPEVNVGRLVAGSALVAFGVGAAALSGGVSRFVGLGVAGAGVFVLAGAGTGLGDGGEESGLVAAGGPDPAYSVGIFP